MKILYSHYLTDAEHPAVKMVDSISHEMRELGHEVQIHASAGILPTTTTNSTSTKRSGNFLKSAAKRRLWFAKAMSKNKGRLETDEQAIADFQPDVVLARQDAYCWSVVQAALNKDVPVVTYADAPVAYESRQFNDERRWHPPGLVERIEKWGLINSKAVITVSRPSRKILDRYQLSTPIHVIPNGINASRFERVGENARMELKKKLGIPDGIVVGFQGTFKAFHGIDRLRHLIHATAGRTDLVWILIGDGPELPAVKEAVRGNPNVFVLGRQPASEMNRLLSLVDIAIAPHSQMKGEFYFCPLKILEYAASGCATIASDQGDIPWLLAEGNGGVIVKDDRLDSWKTALETLLEDEDLRNQSAIAAREHVLNNLTWKHTARQVADVLLDVRHFSSGKVTLGVVSPYTSNEPDDEQSPAETIGA